MDTSPRSRRERRRADGDRGLVIVEFAIILPLLAMLIAGIIEFGMAWRDSLTVSSGTRSAARVVSNLGSNRLSDYEALLTLDAALQGLSTSYVVGVLIYDASAVDGAIPPACFGADGTPKSITGSCNYYSAAMIDSMSISNFDGVSATTCSATSWDHFYCPTSRETRQNQGLEIIGVWVRVKRGWFTNMFPGQGLTVEHRTVMNAEPGS